MMERVKGIIWLSTIYPYFNYILKTKFEVCYKKSLIYKVKTKWDFFYLNDIFKTKLWLCGKNVLWSNNIWLRH